MDIAAASIDMSIAKVQQQAGYSMAKKVMNLQEVQTDSLIRMMETAAPKLPDRMLDIRA